MKLIGLGQTSLMPRWKRAVPFTPVSMLGLHFFGTRCSSRVLESGLKARRVFVTLRGMKLGDDLRDARWIYLKGFLFLLIGLAAGALILLEMPTLRVAALLSLCVWAWCRFYYFLFYVIEKYVDGRFRFAGVGSFVLYWLRRKAE